MQWVISVGLFLFLLAGGSATVGGQKTVEPRALSRASVLIIGTTHAPECFLAAPGYSNAHLRAMLNRFRPTMIGVESNPVWMARGILNRVTYEAQVAVNWAARDHVPAYGLDWAPLESLADANRAGLKRARDADPPPQSMEQRRGQAAQTRGALKEFYSTYAQHPGDLFRWLNMEGAEARGRADEELRLKGSPAQIARLQDLAYRNGRIAEQILALVRRYPGARLAVVMGLGHKWSLEQALSKAADVDLVRWQSLPAITPADAVAAWEPLDSLGTLREAMDGVLFYFDPEAVDLTLVREHLERLARAGVDTEEVRYFRARALGLEKRYDEAEALLGAVGQFRSGETFSYRLTNGWWEFPVAFMARVELAKIQDLRGNRTAALAGYRAALIDLERMTPPVPADDSFRDLEAWITDGHIAFYKVWTCQVARQTLQALIQEPFSHVFAGLSLSGRRDK